ncbi:MAG: hypothetical protein JO215_14715 [Ktedonobacteraceae bacterium]|nr:hypothetical protein [Ktedonobacteraceae bacterium]MBV9614479.1 hypothetical protein [Ktedonobacteraceae bacterium]MBV9709808.1 hypothetical protein [Ktedonobacteraceae bacterium]
MSRDGDRREARFVIPSANGVSSAVWPAGERRSVATSWFAQQRRSFVMRGIGPSYVQRCIVRCLRCLYSVLIAALVLIGIVLAVLIFQYWMILFIVATAWSILIVFTTRLLCDKCYSIVCARLDRRLRSQRQRPRPLSALSQFPQTPMPAAPLIRVLETIDLSTTDMEQFIESESKLETSAQISLVQKERAHSAEMQS